MEALFVASGAPVTLPVSEVHVFIWPLVGSFSAVLSAVTKHVVPREFGESLHPPVYKSTRILELHRSAFTLPEEAWRKHAREVQSGGTMAQSWMSKMQNTLQKHGALFVPNEAAWRQPSPCKPESW